MLAWRLQSMRNDLHMMREEQPDNIFGLADNYAVMQELETELKLQGKI